MLESNGRRLCVVSFAKAEFLSGTQMQQNAKEAMGLAQFPTSTNAPQ
jgi:hypothetical protein